MENVRLCRICIAESGSSILLPIFGEDELWKKITSFANVHIEEGDSLPQKVCLICAKNAIDACSFKQKCEEADSFFRKELLRKMELRLPVDTEIISVASFSRQRQRRHTVSEETLPTKDGNINHSTSNQTMQQIEEQESFNKNAEDGNITEDSDDNIDDFPVLMEESMGLPNGYHSDWDNSGVIDIDEQQDNHEQQEQHQQQQPQQQQSAHHSSIDDKFDDSLPLIPEIELITPNDEEEEEGEALTNRDTGEYECSICSKLFAMKSVLKHHIRNYHPEASQQYECYECKKLYLSKRFLEKHIRMGRCVKKRKNTTRPMQCSECRTVFPTGHHLGWHKRTGNCRSRSPKLSLKEYEQKNDSDANADDNEDEQTSKNNAPEIIRKPGRGRPRKFEKFKSKRGGRTRITLDSKKIALAKELVKQQVSTTKFAQELKISRTFAWRLRKTLEANMYKEGKGHLVKSVPSTIQIPMKNENLDKPQMISNLNESTTDMAQNLLQMFQDHPNILLQQQMLNGLFSLPNELYENQMKQLYSAVMTSKPIFQNNKALLDSLQQQQLLLLQQQQLEQSKLLEMKDVPTDLSKSNKNVEDLNMINNKNKLLAMNGTQVQSHVDDRRYEHLKNFQPTCSNIDLSGTITLNNNEKEEQMEINAQLRALSQAMQHKKPRKRNVFIDEQKYAHAKILVANNASTMDIAKILDISQMSAWKLRDCILKNIPFTFKKPTDTTITETEASNSIATSTKTTIIPQPPPPPLQLPPPIPIPSTSSQSQLKIDSNPISTKNNAETTVSPLSPTTIITDSSLKASSSSSLSPTKLKVPRQRLKRDERVQRDKIIAKEILSLINEDSNIQYWKVAKCLAAKGYPISPSSVCQRLKSMGIHRRLRLNESQQQSDSNMNERQNENCSDQDDYDYNNDEDNDVNDTSNFLKAHFNNFA